MVTSLEFLTTPENDKPIPVAPFGKVHRRISEYNRPEHARRSSEVDMIEMVGDERITANSAGDWGPSNPRRAGVQDFIVEMR